MSVLLETSLGDIVVDLFIDKCPRACENFIKLCKLKFYNNALFYNLQTQYLAKIGHMKQKPTSIFHIMDPNENVYFKDEIQQDLKIKKKGLIGTANLGPNLNHSEFFITLTDDHLAALNGKHSIFGIVAEGLDVLDKINKVYCDKESRPLVNIRIFHTLILEDPIPNPEGLVTPDESPEPILKSDDRLDINQDMEILFDNDKNQGEVIEEIKKHKAKTKAIVLETLDDLPDADIKPPENVLFVCKLNPVTTERDLELIFSVYGPIKRCDVIRDWKTGQSLQYSFIEFETKAACEEAYFKMENALIDERRIHVDFSQSVSKLWNKYKFKDNEDKKKSFRTRDREIELKDRYVPERKNIYEERKPRRERSRHREKERRRKRSYGSSDSDRRRRKKDKRSKRKNKY